MKPANVVKCASLAVAAEKMAEACKQFSALMGGWNGCNVEAGQLVLVNKPGFGRNCRAWVISVNRFGEAEVQILTISPKAAIGLKPGNRIDVNVGWLDSTIKQPKEPGGG